MTYKKKLCSQHVTDPHILVYIFLKILEELFWKNIFFSVISAMKKNLEAVYCFVPKVGKTWMLTPKAYILSLFNPQTD